MIQTYVTLPSEGSFVVTLAPPNPEKQRHTINGISKPWEWSNAYQLTGNKASPSRVIPTHSLKLLSVLVYKHRKALIILPILGLLLSSCLSKPLHLPKTKEQTAHIIYLHTSADRHAQKRRSQSKKKKKKC